MVFRTAKKMMLMGLGLAAITAEKAEQVVQDLVSEGELSSEEGQELLGVWRKRIEDEHDQLRLRIQNEVKKALTKAGAASQDDVARLEARISALESRLEN